MKRTRSAGGIVLNERGELALVMSRNSRSWLFPKGHVDPGESDEDTARRELEEETGLIHLEYLDDLGEFSRPRFQGDDAEPEEKTIRMFLFAAERDAALTPSMEVIAAKWVPYREAPDLLGTPHEDWFPADRAWFASVFPRVREAIQRD